MTGRKWKWTPTIVSWIGYVLWTQTLLFSSHLLSLEPRIWLSTSTNPCVIRRPPRSCVKDYPLLSLAKSKPFRSAYNCDDPNLELRRWQTLQKDEGARGSQSNYPCPVLPAASYANDAMERVIAAKIDDHSDGTVVGIATMISGRGYRCWFASGSSDE